MGAVTRLGEPTSATDLQSNIQKLAGLEVIMRTHNRCRLDVQTPASACNGKNVRRTNVSDKPYNALGCTQGRRVIITALITPLSNILRDFGHTRSPKNESPRGQDQKSGLDPWLLKLPALAHAQTQAAIQLHRANLQSSWPAYAAAHLFPLPCDCAPLYCSKGRQSRVGGKLRTP